MVVLKYPRAMGGFGGFGGVAYLNWSMRSRWDPKAAWDPRFDPKRSLAPPCATKLGSKSSLGSQTGPQNFPGTALHANVLLGPSCPLKPNPKKASWDPKFKPQTFPTSLTHTPKLPLRSSHSPKHPRPSPFTPKPLLSPPKSPLEPSSSPPPDFGVPLPPPQCHCMAVGTSEGAGDIWGRSRGILGALGPTPGECGVTFGVPRSLAPLRGGLHVPGSLWGPPQAPP